MYFLSPPKLEFFKRIPLTPFLQHSMLQETLGYNKTEQLLE